MAVTYSGAINNLILTKSAYSQGEAIYGAVDFTATKSGVPLEWIPGTSFGWHVWIRAYDADGTLLDGDSTIHVSSPLSLLDSFRHTTRNLYLGLMGSNNKACG